MAQRHAHPCDLERYDGVMGRSFWTMTALMLNSPSSSLVHRVLSEIHTGILVSNIIENSPNWSPADLPGT